MTIKMQKKFFPKINLFKNKNILIIGFGSIGKKYYSLLKRNYKNINIIIFSKTFSTKKNFINTFEELKNINLYLCIICTPSNSHLYYCEKIIPFTKNILVEKPISNSIVKANTFYKKIKNKRNRIYIGYNLRQLESINYLRALIKNKKYGKLLTFRLNVGQYLPSWRKFQDYTKTASAQKFLGGGALLELSHEIDYLSYMIGDIKSFEGKVQKVSKLKIDTEDNVFLLLNFSKKLTGSLHLNFLEHIKNRTGVFIFSEATIYLDCLKNKITIFKIDGSKIVKNFELNFNSTYLMQIEKIFKIKNNLSSINSAIKILDLISKIKKN